MFVWLSIVVWYAVFCIITMQLGCFGLVSTMVCGYEVGRRSYGITSDLCEMCCCLNTAWDSNEANWVNITYVHMDGV